jgi:hypothetical protein
MESPLNISQFHALLHSKKDQTQLMSSLFTLTQIGDLQIFVDGLSPLGLWGGWR